jgi:asparagine synthase (glutamine-hydrolysing)
MCGFAGIFHSQSKKTKGDYLNLVSSMSNALRHRGPDSSGQWVDESMGFAFAHRRLAIIDLSFAGHQPMASKLNQYILAFNGEIYNHLEIRTELEAIFSLSSNEIASLDWRGYSDTETLLAAFEVWGIEATLKKTVGMFAFALWDTQNKKLHLARDRFGEKPLYYGWTGAGDDRAFVFGSELKALRAYPGFNNKVCRQALMQYMRLSVVPAPMSIYEGINKLEPGCLLTLSAVSLGNEVRGDAQEGGKEIKQWWSLAQTLSDGEKSQIADESEAVDALDKQLKESIRLQSLADVPLGAFLSGGVDSSTVVAMMQHQSNSPIKTFTIGFDEAGFDESPYARAVAEYLGTDHYEMRVSAQMAQGVIPTLPSMYDEPFADSSQIPTHLVSKAAKEQVTVSLSGDAGDELFGGYNRYFWGPRVWNCLRWMPFTARYALGAAIEVVPVSGWDALAKPVNAILPVRRGIVRAGDKAHNLASRLQHVQNLDDLLKSLATVWHDPADVVRTQEGPSELLPPAPSDALSIEGIMDLDPVARMMFIDSVTYLPDDILCKVDRAAMACSLETRVPFLDHRVAELAWRLPMHMKVRGTTGKWALRQVLYKYVPKELIERPKAGFAIPLGQWLRGPLRDWAEALLSEQRLQSEGFFYAKPIRTAWIEHLAGTRDHTSKLWTVLMFQAWLEAQS